MFPDVGDIAWVDFDPVKGSEQAGRRPGLILTPEGYHQRSRRAIVCPITSNERPWPFNVGLPDGMRTRGAVLVDQVRSIERSERMFDIIERAPVEVITAVRMRLADLLGFELGSSIIKPPDSDTT